MTEKRFTIADGFKIVAIKDNDKIMNSKQVCEKLNELAEEKKQLTNENKELKLQLEAFKDKLCELGVSDVKLYGKRYYTGLEEWLE